MRRSVLDSLAHEPTEINMAPLIDMVFILLIFFLVTTTFVQETGISVRRPKAASSDTLEKDNVLIAITPTGTIHMNNREVSLMAVRGLVKRALTIREQPVVIIADGATRTKILVDVMDECRLAGAKDLSIASEKEE